jgi:hypothetical protein
MNALGKADFRRQRGLHLRPVDDDAIARDSVLEIFLVFVASK